MLASFRKLGSLAVTVKSSHPISVTLPDHGVLFAQSAHAANFRMSERADPFHKLIYVLAGQITLRENSEPAAECIQAGHIVVVPRGVRHVIEDEKQSTLLLLCLDEPFFSIDLELSRLWLAVARAQDHFIPLARPNRLQVEALWRRAMLEALRPGLGQATTVKSIAAQLLVLLARLPAPRDADRAVSRVRSVIREINESFFDDWNLDRAAVRAGLSRRQFSALFRRAAKQSFGDYLSDLRLRHAARLLLANEQSILGVMFSCGFQDLSNFYRLFRARYGSPPGVWLRKRTGRPPGPSGGASTGALRSHVGRKRSIAPC